MAPDIICRAPSLPAAPDASGRTTLGVEVDAAPFLARSVSTVDSGYSGNSGQEEDPDEDSVDSSSFSGAYSDYDGEQSTVKDLVQKAIPLGPPVSFEGDISVRDSTNVQFGNNMHIHGPVTVVVSDKKSIHGVPVPALFPGDRRADGELEGGDAEMGVKTSEPVPLAFVPTVPVGPPGPRGKDKQILLAGTTGKKPLWKARFVQVTAVVVAALLTAVVVLVAITLPYGQEVGRVEPVPLPNGLTIVDRKGWLAQPPKQGVNDLQSQPVDHVIIHHSATEPCFNYPECLKMTRNIQMFHMESNGWSDIGYNFLVGGDGYVYEGRGWDKEGAHTFQWNKRSVGICLIGTFSYQRPTIEQMRTTIKLIEYGVQLGKVRAGYKLAGVCQLRSTDSPGSLVQADISRWQHWWNYTVGDSNCK